MSDTFSTDPTGRIELQKESPGGTAAGAFFLVTGHWSLDTGHWSLGVISHLVIGGWSWHCAPCMHHRAVSVGLHGLNLLNKHTVSHLSLLKEDGTPNIGRSVNLTVFVPFGA